MARFPLAEALLEKARVNGTTTSANKISKLERPELSL
jgi:hypothetical protein